ncbi:TPA: hypothetical protein U1V77_002223 [Streptococcus suis]|nr:hypothetical protein [Streptococcus suis]
MKVIFIFLLYLNSVDWKNGLKNAAGIAGESFYFNIIYSVITGTNPNKNYNFYFQFYEEMYQIYLSGHLPVGYEGDYPNGTFYVMNPQSEE